MLSSYIPNCYPLKPRFFRQLSKAMWSFWKENIGVVWALINQHSTIWRQHQSAVKQGILKTSSELRSQPHASNKIHPIGLPISNLTAIKLTPSFLLSNYGNWWIFSFIYLCIISYQKKKRKKKKKRELNRIHSTHSHYE